MKEPNQYNQFVPTQATHYCPLFDCFYHANALYPDKPALAWSNKHGPNWQPCAYSNEQVMNMPDRLELVKLNSFKKEAKNVESESYQDSEPCDYNGDGETSSD